MHLNPGLMDHRRNYPLRFTFFIKSKCKQS